MVAAEEEHAACVPAVSVEEGEDGAETAMGDDMFDGAAWGNAGGWVDELLRRPVARRCLVSSRGAVLGCSRLIEFSSPVR